MSSGTRVDCYDYLDILRSEEESSIRLSFPPFGKGKSATIYRADDAEY